MKSRVVAILCDPGVGLDCLEDSLNSLFFQVRKPDRVVAGISEGSPERIHAISRFGFEVAIVLDGSWRDWIVKIAGEEPEARLALMEAGQFWPVGRLKELEAIDATMVRGPTGYVFPTLGAEWQIHAEPPAADVNLEKARELIRVTSTALVASREFTDGVSGGSSDDARLDEWSRRVRFDPTFVKNRGAASFFRHAAERELEEKKKLSASLQLSSFRNRHAARRAFVVGNGPSLAKMDMGLLRNEITFGSNGIFLLFPKSTFRPTYYCCMDSVVLPDRAPDIRSMLDAHPGITGFFPDKIGDHDTVGMSWWVPSIIGSRSNVCFYESRWADLSGDPWDAVSQTPWEFIREGRSVTINLLQLAFLMGCNPIYLIGCDTEYTVPRDVRVLEDFSDRPDKRFISSGDDPNHFDPSYFGKGRVWHKPNPEMMIEHYSAMRTALEPEGIEIINATNGGRLDVFPRTSFESIFSQ